MIKDNKSYMTVGTVITSTAIIGSLTWCLLQTVGLKEQTSAIVEWQNNTNEKLTEYQDSSEKKMDNLSDDVTKLKIDSGTTKELIKLIGDRYQINSDAVEARVIRDINIEDASSSLSLK